MVGTPYYLSPELCENKPYSYKTDVWALGCVLYEMVTNSRPFQANNQGALLLRIVQGKYPAINKSLYSPELLRISKSMLQKDVRLRPTIEDLLLEGCVQRHIRICGLEVPAVSSLELQTLNFIPYPILILCIFNRMCCIVRPSERHHVYLK